MDQKQIRQYFENEINPIFTPLILSLVKFRPEDIGGFCKQYFWQINENQAQSDKDTEDDQEIPDQQFKMKRNHRLANSTRKNRTAFCTEVYGTYNCRKIILLPKGSKKSEKAEMQILFGLFNSFLFDFLNETDKKLLIDCMILQTVNADEVIIQEGDWDQLMYFVYQGECECYKQSQGSSKLLKTYYSGDMFGQLALISNGRRSTTIIAKTYTFLYSLSRQVYRHIVKLAVIKKRSFYMEIIQKVAIFDKYSNDDFEKMCDMLKQVSYETGEWIILEGDIVLSGILVVQKNGKMVQCLKEGDYFGQVALLNDTPRQASVKTLTQCVLVYLTQKVFKRMNNGLKNSIPNLQKYAGKRIISKTRNLNYQILRIACFLDNRYFEVNTGIYIQICFIEEINYCCNSKITMLLYQYQISNSKICFAYIYLLKIKFNLQFYQKKLKCKCNINTEEQNLCSYMDLKYKQNKVQIRKTEINEIEFY